MIKSSAPSNIALIKYMGKSQVSGNRPTNSSLSFTLNHLRTEVEIKESSQTDEVRVSKEGPFPLSLSEKGKKRFLDFFSYLKAEFSLPGFYELTSSNNFPSDCGLASSASSFAALTQASYDLALNLGTLDIELSCEELASISQKGSGSSCRSFFHPFSLWSSSGGASAVDLGIADLVHSALIFENQKKQVSSSEAHIRVLASDLFLGRVERAESRLKLLIESLRSGEWERSYEICWQEFWDMHALFETSSPPFGYLNAQAVEALKSIRRFWQENKEGPIVTMDAGPNVHLLFREDQKNLREKLLAQLKSEILSFEVIHS